MYSIALFGGAFDPVHNGHIKTSLSVQSHYQFDAFFFVPCKSPTIKAESIASPQQRLDMLDLAIKPYPQFKIDTREIERSSPSYMVDTLTSFRDDHQDASLTLIVGYDAFLSLPKWHQWEALISLANLLVINRNQYSNEKLPEKLEILLKNHRQDDLANIVESKSGIIQFYDAGNYDLSSSAIRHLLKSNADLVSYEIPKEVHDYIKLQGLYQ
ncbi:nicotinate-nucleotide adenylyltransferase [Legionella waltersii]|uniref:Probable nicotinate-nucleotide adenylyltransferase n=1 Tax=Legionella waltersii TaxID=66969 RepID=A0A0W1ALY9_9GAMM|nr:nicotinate-nucleotide adenylyltransferase [Legionella waltersii]KTD82351.1 nicotinate-nucleotide adenylyltransferase [Legionella waltersii]SNV03889.1 nicotinate-nucleotide adenylyltransferase [Legionella waltersii]